MITIKQYEPSMQSDIETCFRSCVESLGWEYQPRGRHSDILHIENMYMRDGSFWCLFLDNKLIGMVAVRCIDRKNNIAEMKRLYILPKYQGKGYGDMLFKYALDYAKEQGYSVMRLDTRHDRAASLHLINKYKFQRVERYNDNEFAELYFELDLTKHDMGGFGINITIRPAVLTDAPDMAEVHMRSWEVAYKDIIPAEYIKEKNATRPAM